MHRVLGCDVSLWQTSGKPAWDGIDWPLLATRVDFVFIKASECNKYSGKSFTDPAFLNNWAGATAVNLLRGAYHFYRKNGSPVEQAQFFAQVLSKVDTAEMLPPVLDVEEHGTPAAPVKACLEEIERLTGRIPMIYTSSTIWQEIGVTNWAARYPLWLAQYPFKAWQADLVDLMHDYNPHPPAPWPSWHVWQFTQKAPGLEYGLRSKQLDLNYFNGGLEALKIFAGGGNPPPPPPQGTGTQTALYRVVAPLGLNVRGGPGQSYYKYGALPRNTLVEVLGIVEVNGDVWLQVAPSRYACARWNGLTLMEPVV